MKRMMQWVIAATRPLVLTMGPLVLTMVFCSLGVFTSCSKDDDNPVDSVDLETIPLGATLSCLQPDGDSIQMENKGDGLFETTFIEVKDASNLNATVSIRYQVPGGFEKTITKEFAISHDDCPARVGDWIHYVLDAYYLNPKLTAEIIDTTPTEEKIAGRWKVTNVTSGYLMNEGEILEIHDDHTSAYVTDGRYYDGNWTLQGKKYKSRLYWRDDVYYDFDLNLYAVTEDMIEVKGQVGYNDGGPMKFDDVHCFLIRER